MFKSFYSKDKYCNESEGSYLYFNCIFLRSKSKKILLLKMKIPHFVMLCCIGI